MCIFPALKETLSSLLRELHRRIVTLNLFPRSTDIHDGIYSTRIFILLLGMGILVLVFYASISLQIRSVTVDQPSLSVYENLYNQYPSTLVCPCTRYSMSYQSIMNVEVRYHQVCTSDVIKDNTWLIYLKRPSGSLPSADFRVSGTRLFILLQSLCQLSNETVINELNVFNSRQFLSAKVVPENTFHMQTSSIIGQFQQQVENSVLFYPLSLSRYFLDGLFLSRSVCIASNFDRAESIL